MLLLRLMTMIGTLLMSQSASGIVESLDNSALHYQLMLISSISMEAVVHPQTNVMTVESWKVSRKFRCCCCSYCCVWFAASPAMLDSASTRLRKTAWASDRWISLHLSWLAISCCCCCRSTQTICCNWSNVSTDALYQPLPFSSVSSWYLSLLEL